MDKWQYFENEGAYYRSRDTPITAWIDDIWTADGWKPYLGDKAASYFSATPITKDQLPEVARPRPRMIDLTEQYKGKAFQILAAPGKQKK